MFTSAATPTKKILRPTPPLCPAQVLPVMGRRPPERRIILERHFDTRRLIVRSGYEDTITGTNFRLTFRHTDERDLEEH